ncbi:MAG: hypothetical protein V1789_00765 [PVC group bacterium]
MKGGAGFSRRAFGLSVRVLAPAFLFAAPAPAGEEYGPVELAFRERGTYQARLPDDDAVRWTADWVLERVDEGPPAKYAVRDQLRGRFEGDDREQTRVTEAEFLLDRGRIRMQHSLLTVRDQKGRVVHTLEKEFDYGKGVVRTRAVYPENGKTKRDEFEMRERLVDTKEIVSFLRGFPFPPPEEAEDEDAELEFTLLNESPDTYSVLVTCEGIEEVETPAGTFPCYKLRLVPDLGILTFLGRMLAPDIYMWFSVAPPHFWVKYRGLEGDLGSPSVVSELVEFNTAPAPAATPASPVPGKQGSIEP